MNSIFTFKSERSKSILLLAITATLWSLGGILIKSVDIHPIAIAGIRSAIASVILLATLKRPKFTWSKPQIGAAIAYTATVMLFVAANKMTTAANAILLQYTAPIYVAILGTWFLKEKTTSFDWMIVFIVVGGMCLFFLDKLSINGFWGNILALASGVSFAFLTIFMRMQKDGSPLESILLGNILTIIIAIPFILKSSPTKSGWINLIILGVFQLGIPYILYSKAIKHVTALEAILIPVLEPILNPIWVFLMLGEAPGTFALIGGFIVIAAVTFRCIRTIKR